MGEAMPMPVMTTRRVAMGASVDIGQPAASGRAEVR
jgi:hypothetical protein